MEYENGMTATYITAVTEFPGSNRLEIVGNKGKIVYEDDKISLYKILAASLFPYKIGCCLCQLLNAIKDITFLCAFSFLHDAVLCAL